METPVTTLRSLKMMEIKTNYSSLSREFRMDRHTIKKMYERPDVPLRGIGIEGSFIHIIRNGSRLAVPSMSSGLSISRLTILFAGLRLPL